MKTLDDTTKTILVLDQARELIRDPKAWHQGKYIRYADGPGPTSFCMVGALMYVTRQTHSRVTCSLPAYRALQDVVDRPHIPSWNDYDATHADVMAAFDLAIESLRDG